MGKLRCSQGKAYSIRRRSYGRGQKARRLFSGSTIAPSIAPLDTLIMGVVNLTPDSFSDGGNFLDPARALAHIERLFDEGADIVDLGAESSRPGAQVVDLEEEWRRLFPILTGLSRLKLPGRISLDTYKPEIMRRALAFPVDIINDISGGADLETLQLLAKNGLIYLAMHMHRNPASMQKEPLTAEVAVAEVAAFYRQTELRLLQAGFHPSRIWLDPGIGFGKTDAANLSLLRQAQSLMRRYSIVIGISRKSFLGRLFELENPADRDPVSKMLELSCMLAGAKVIRTHEVSKLFQIRGMLQSQA